MTFGARVFSSSIWFYIYLYIGHIFMSIYSNSMHASTPERTNSSSINISSSKTIQFCFTDGSSVRPKLTTFRSQVVLCGRLQYNIVYIQTQKQTISSCIGIHACMNVYSYKRKLLSHIRHLESSKIPHITVYREYLWPVNVCSWNYRINYKDKNRAIHAIHTYIRIKRF